jgi:extracellular factor (EF) 3-hydroxypalmitic acid methyl ester biosynthesis protein
MLHSLEAANGTIPVPSQKVYENILRVAPPESLDFEALNGAYEKIREGRALEGMTELLPVLQAGRLKENAASWAELVQACLRHPLRQLVHQDPFTNRAFSKPRGYAGDAVLLDFVYGREEGWPVPAGTSDLGRRIFNFTTGSSACEAVRARRGFIANMVDRMVDEVSRPHILSIAAGHLREALLCAAIKRRKFGRYVALDADAASLEEVARCYGPWGVEVVLGTIRQMLTQRIDLGSFDFVYSTGLFDYLPLAAAQRLTRALFQVLRPRGRLLLANFLPGILDVGYMESYMAWNLIYRTRQEMVQLADEIPQALLRDIHIFAEENQNIIFLQVTRA